jgi:hypothetical protein
MKYIPILFVAILTSCTLFVPTPATEEQKKAAIDSSYFDKQIIGNLSSYENLKNFLLINLDTIIKFRYSKNSVTMVGQGGSTDSTYLQDDECYRFFEGNDRYDITNVPDFLKKKLEKTYTSIGKSNINSFTVCKDKKIIIEAKVSSGGEGLYISHELIWNSKVEDDYRYDKNKDTVILFIVLA